MLSKQTLAWLQNNNFSENNWQLVDKYGNNALSAAILQKQFSIAQELLNTKALNINQSNGDGNNALWFACFKENIDLIQQLIEAGITINHQNLVGVTCLMYAASAGKTEVVEILLQAGADTKLTNQDDFTALDFAANVKILKLLKAYK